MLAKLLKFDLAGRFASVKRQYKRSPWMIGSDEVVCTIVDWLGSNSEVCASCYCGDPLLADASNVYWFYRKSQPSRSAAESLLLQEVARASSLHPGTRFLYRRQKIGGFEDYVNGIWSPTLDKPATTRCGECGKPAEPPTCGACGGFVVG